MASRILLEDVLTLDKGKWLNGAIMEYYNKNILNFNDMIIVDGKKVISELYCFCMCQLNIWYEFEDKDLNNLSIAENDRLTFNKTEMNKIEKASTLLLPICIDNTHYILAVIETSKDIFSINIVDSIKHSVSDKRIKKIVDLITKIFNKYGKIHGNALKTNFTNMAVLQQENGHDCGIHVIHNITLIYNDIVLNKGSWQSKINKKYLIDKKPVNLRDHYREIIYKKLLLSDSRVKRLMIKMGITSDSFKIDPQKLYKYLLKHFKDEITLTKRLINGEFGNIKDIIHSYDHGNDTDIITRYDLYNDELRHREKKINEKKNIKKNEEEEIKRNEEYEKKQIEDEEIQKKKDEEEQKILTKLDEIMRRKAIKDKNDQEELDRKHKEEREEIKKQYEIRMKKDEDDEKKRKNRKFRRISFDTALEMAKKEKEEKKKINAKPTSGSGPVYIHKGKGVVHLASSYKYPKTPSQKGLFSIPAIVPPYIEKLRKLNKKKTIKQVPRPLTPDITPPVSPGIDIPSPDITPTVSPDVPIPSPMTVSPVIINNEVPKLSDFDGIDDLFSFDDDIVAGDIEEDVIQHSPIQDISQQVPVVNQPNGPDSSGPDGSDDGGDGDGDGDEDDANIPIAPVSIQARTIMINNILDKLKRELEQLNDDVLDVVNRQKGKVFKNSRRVNKKAGDKKTIFSDRHHNETFKILTDDVTHLPQYLPEDSTVQEIANDGKNISYIPSNKDNLAGNVSIINTKSGVEYIKDLSLADRPNRNERIIDNVGSYICYGCGDRYGKLTSDGFCNRCKSAKLFKICAFCMANIGGSNYKRHIDESCTKAIQLAIFECDWGRQRHPVTSRMLNAFDHNSSVLYCNVIGYEIKTMIDLLYFANLHKNPDKRDASGNKIFPSNNFQHIIERPYSYMTDKDMVFNTKNRKTATVFEDIKNGVKRTSTKRKKNVIDIAIIAGFCERINYVVNVEDDADGDPESGTHMMRVEPDVNCPLSAIANYFLPRVRKGIFIIGDHSMYKESEYEDTLNDPVINNDNKFIAGLKNQFIQESSCFALEHTIKQYLLDETLNGQMPYNIPFDMFISKK